MDMTTQDLSYQPTQIEITIEGRLFKVDAPINLTTPRLLSSATILSALGGDHSLEYYMMDILESNN